MAATEECPTVTGECPEATGDRPTGGNHNFSKKLFDKYYAVIYNLFNSFIYQFIMIKR